MVVRPDLSAIESELKFHTSRSSGPGGQNVNKVNTKVTLRWNVSNSKILDEEQKHLLLSKLKTKITSDGVLIIISQAKRSQVQNKEEALNKLDGLIIKAFKIEKKRKATKPTKASQQKRIEGKKQLAEKKQWRKKL